MFSIKQCIEENIPLSAGYRDFEGYAGQYPDPQWPGGAKIAINVVLNYEEGGEHSVLNGDSRSENFMTELSGADFKTGKRDISMESMYEYGTRAGVWRLARMFSQKNIRITIYAVGQSILKSPTAAKHLVSCGHEMTSHGYRWIDHHDLPLAVEKTQIGKAIDAIEKIAGTPPKGWFVGRPSVSSKGLICEVFKERGIEMLYQSDAYADDLPYWVKHPVEADKGLLIIPHSLDTNDQKFISNPGFANPEDWLKYMKLAFDVLYEEGSNGEPKMMTISLHNRLIGKPARFWALRELLTYIQSHDGVWFATREEIARHWMKVHPFDETKLKKIEHFL